MWRQFGLCLRCRALYIYAVMSFSLKRFLGAALFPAMLAAVMLSPAAHAGCTDTPAPGIDWKRCYLDERNFQDVDLTGADLRGAFFARSDFTGANFSAIDGRRAKFVTAILNDTRFDDARLIGTDFTKSTLAGASFKGADLRRARFFRADLKGADFTGARLGGTDFLKADLSGATWVDGTTVCPGGSIGQCD